LIYWKSGGNARAKVEAGKVGNERTKAVETPTAAMSRPARFKVAHVAEALRTSGGVISGAAQILAQAYGDCTPQTVRNYIARHPQLRVAVDEAVEFNLDIAETKLIALMSAKRPDINAVKFYLETKGKQRGYTRRQEITGAGGKPIEVSDARERFIAELAEMADRLTAAIGPLADGGAGAAGEVRSNGADKAPASAEQ
jgi:hypothetical protein